MYVDFHPLLRFSVCPSLDFWRSIEAPSSREIDPLVDEDTSASVLKCVVKHLGCRNSMRRGIISCDITCGGGGGGYTLIYKYNIILYPLTLSTSPSSLPLPPVSIPATILIVASSNTFLGKLLPWKAPPSPLPTPRLPPLGI